MAAWSGRGGRYSGGVAGRQQAGRQALTPREHQVLEYIASGRPNKVVAIDLGISMRTVEKHRARIFDKLGVRNAVELVRCWYGRETTGGDGASQATVVAGEVTAGMALQQPLASYQAESPPSYPQSSSAGYAQSCAQPGHEAMPASGSPSQESQGSVVLAWQAAAMPRGVDPASALAKPPTGYCPHCGSVLFVHRSVTGASGLLHHGSVAGTELDQDLGCRPGESGQIG